MNKELRVSSVPYEDGLHERLRSKKYALAYLKESMEQSGMDSPHIVLMALRRIAEVHGMAWLSKEVGVPRPSIYQMLSEEGNPTLSVFVKILGALGFGLSVDDRIKKPADKRRRIAAAG
jgi:probable addiction module antidote protein